MSVATSRTIEGRRAERVRVEGFVVEAGGIESLPSAARISVALAILRVAAGIIFAAHGAQKVFSFTFPGVIEAFAGMGIPLAVVTGPAVAVIELVGGIALAAGLFTPFVAAPLAAVMLGALVMVHLPAGFFMPNGIAFVLILFAAAVALAITGGGAYSADAVLARRRSAD